MLLEKIQKLHPKFFEYGIIIVLLIVGMFFAWSTISYALVKNPITQFIAQKTAKNTGKSAQKNNNTTKEIPTTTARKLDGRTVDTKETNNWPVAVMIENLITVRPQAGLSKEAVVYESLVEGGITRFLALFDPQIENIPKIGPVRSVRPYYVEWAQEYGKGGALLAHAGGSPEALQMIDSDHINDLNQIRGSAPYFWREKGTPAPHNLFTSSELLQRALHDRNFWDAVPEYVTWNFQDSSEKKQNTDTQNAKKITINYSSGISYQVEYQFDETTKEYLRFNASRPHMDRNNNQQIRAKNVIIITIPKILAVGEKGRLTLDIHGEGKVSVARDGEVIIGTWKKENREDRMKFLTAEKKDIDLRRGATWIQIVPEDRSVTFE